MKKILVLLTVMVAFFGFTAGAFAVTCEQCKCELRDIPCPTATQVAPACVGFDYDLHTALDGYCTPGDPTNNCRLIYPICDCANASWFAPGKNVGVKMTILVNGMSGERGAYWSGTGVPGAIAFEPYATYTAACAVGALAHSFGVPNFWDSTGAGAIAPAALTVDTTCTVPVGSRATILTTPVGYVIVLADSGKPHWRIDVPPIRIDPAVIASGSKIAVKVELYDVTAIPGVCPACVGCLCDCTIDVAVVCCSVGAPVTTLNFPYFADLTDALGWWNGIAINNPSAAAGSCTLTAHEKNGNVATATVSVPAGGQFVSLLQDMTWAGATGGISANVTAVCNYLGATGFAMMSNYGGDSMGYKVP